MSTFPENAPGRARARSAIERMLRPRSIAIVGASPSPGSLGRKRARQPGALRVWWRHPSGERQTRAEINGRPCVNSTSALPEGVDCAVLAIPRSGILDAVAGCAARGVGGVIIYAAGFAEAGPEGRGASGGDFAHRPRSRHGDFGSKLSRSHQLRGRHPADLQCLHASPGGRTP